MNGNKSNIKWFKYLKPEEDITARSLLVVKLKVCDRNHHYHLTRPFSSLRPQVPRVYIYSGRFTKWFGREGKYEIHKLIMQILEGQQAHQNESVGGGRGEAICRRRVIQRY